MKKFVFLFGLLSTTVLLSACGSKDFKMSFEEALEIANHSKLQTILAENHNFEQNFDISSNFDTKWTKVDANIVSNSKQSIDNTNSESSTKFNANITVSGEVFKIDWTLDLKMANDTIYLNLSSLNLTWSDSLLMIGMMVEWFKNQWLSIPMTGLSEMPSSLSILKDSEKLNNKAKEIIVNEWSTVYNWKFKEFNWYNAWKISLDNEKLNALIKEYYNTLSGDAEVEIPELSIQEFEWYLVITWKDKVTTIIENMKMQDNETSMDADGFAWEDYEINIYEWWESLIKIVAEKKSSKYDVSITLTDAVLLNWTITPKLSKSWINLKFDATLIVKAEEEWDTDTVIPFKGSWSYEWISDFTISIPENAQDLSELLWAYLGGISWWSDEDFEAIYGEDDLTLGNAEISEDSEEVENNENEENNAENTEVTTEVPALEAVAEVAENQ